MTVVADAEGEASKPCSWGALLYGRTKLLSTGHSTRISSGMSMTSSLAIFCYVGLDWEQEDCCTIR